MLVSIHDHLRIIALCIRIITGPWHSVSCICDFTFCILYCALCAETKRETRVRVRRESESTWFLVTAIADSTEEQGSTPAQRKPHSSAHTPFQLIHLLSLLSACTPAISLRLKSYKTHHKLLLCQTGDVGQLGVSHRAGCWNIGPTDGKV